MKIQITREQYCALREEQNPSIKLDMEATYFMETGVTPKGKRKSPVGRRSPTDLVRHKVGWENVPASTERRSEAADHARVLLEKGKEKPVESRGFGYAIAKKMKCSQDMGSYYVSMMIKEGTLEVVE